MKKVTKSEYMEHLKKKMLKYLKELAEEDGTDGTEGDLFKEEKEAIQKAVTVGELFEVMSNMAFDIPGAVQFAMEDLIICVGTFEFMDCPMRGWDT